MCVYIGMYEYVYISPSPYAHIYINMCNIYTTNVITWNSSESKKYSLPHRLVMIK